MQFTNKHKAMLITFLVSGTIILVMFNVQIKKQEKRIAESFYEIEPEKILTEEEALKVQEQIQNSKAETNKAFNQDAKSQRFAQAYRRIAPPEDYVRPDLSATQDGLSSNKDVEKVAPIDKKEIESFSKVNDVLKKQLEEEDVNNAKSSMSYSLVNRKHRFLPTPIYLCERGGKIVINITVNASGKVVEAKTNGASRSSDQCLIDHAIEYAKRARFNSASSTKSQIGTITFYFEGKR